MESRYGQKELARAHYEVQRLRKLWKPLQGLMKGTIFPELYRRVYYREEHRSWEGYNPYERWGERKNYDGQ